MGIRFYCPNGHKLHVKAFQAGMRGICPYCGAKVQIPLQSTRESTKLLRARRRQLAAERAANQGSQAAVADDRASHGSSDPQVMTSPPLEFGASEDGQSSTPSFGSEPVPEYRSFPSPLTEEEVGTSLVTGDRVAVPPDATGTAELAVSAATEESLSERAGGESDDVLADTHLVWYVRPPSGGQFGPATGDIMRQWLQEGRITPDTFVWREGWRDWQEARHLFSSFGGRELPQAASISPAAERILSQRTPRPAKRRSPWILAVLATIAVAVIATLAYFLLGGFGGST